ncbi:hypothetical protein HBB16_19595 [Pseudonocardia sp. MCCB 268]|nr:hypothetical protein [Pseudonocardia cytotoxica]
MFYRDVHPTGADRALAAAAEDLGYSEVWGGRGLLVTAGSSRPRPGATRTVTQGLGVVASVVRHPAVTAMNADRPISPRTVPAWDRARRPRLDVTGRWRSRRASPLAASLEVRELASASLPAGDTVDAEGKQFTFRPLAATHRLCGREDVLLTGAFAEAAEARGGSRTAP